MCGEEFVVVVEFVSSLSSLCRRLISLPRLSLFVSGVIASVVSVPGLWIMPARLAGSFVDMFLVSSPPFISGVLMFVFNRFVFPIFAPVCIVVLFVPAVFAVAISLSLSCAMFIVVLHGVAFLGGVAIFVVVFTVFTHVLCSPLCESAVVGESFTEDSLELKVRVLAETLVVV